MSKHTPGPWHWIDTIGSMDNDVMPSVEVLDNEKNYIASLPNVDNAALITAAPAMLLPAVACFLLMGTAPVLGQVMLGGFLLGFAAGAESDVNAFLAAMHVINLISVHDKNWLPTQARWRSFGWRGE